MSSGEFRVPYVETVRIQDIESPVYSIVVPVGNLYGARVRNCLRSLQLQTVGSLEVIVVDYGSTPKNHRRLMETLEPFNCTVFYFPTLDVWSMSLSRNIGVRRARGEYVATLDADCVLVPAFLECVLSLHREMPRLIVVAPYFLDKKFAVGKLDLPGDYEKLRAYKCRYITGSVGGFMSAPRSWWLKVRGFDERMKMYGSEDGDLCKRADRDCEIELYKAEKNHELDVRFYHQWHPSMRLYKTIGKKIVLRQHEKNRMIKKSDVSIKRNARGWGLKPRVAVCVLTLKRPAFLSQCLLSIARTEIPIKLFLVNQGDESEKQMKVIKKWMSRPDVKYILNKPAKWPGAASDAVFTMAHDMGYEYVVTVDDDCCLLPGAIENLVKAADTHPEFHSISGFIITKKGRHMLGGEKVPQCDGVKYRNYTHMPGIREAAYVSAGFRLIRLNPLVVPDSKSEVILTDWDYANILEEQGLRMAVCGDAGAYHKFKMVNGKMKQVGKPPGYKRAPLGAAKRMAKYFEEKWGYKVK